MLRGGEGRGVVPPPGRGMPAPLWESSRVEGLKECASWVERARSEWTLKVIRAGGPGWRLCGPSKCALGAQSAGRGRGGGGPEGLGLANPNFDITITV